MVTSFDLRLDHPCIENSCRLQQCFSPERSWYAYRKVKPDEMYKNSGFSKKKKKKVWLMIFRTMCATLNRKFWGSHTLIVFTLNFPDILCSSPVTLTSPSPRCPRIFLSWLVKWTFCLMKLTCMGRRRPKSPWRFWRGCSPRRMGSTLLWLGKGIWLVLHLLISWTFLLFKWIWCFFKIIFKGNKKWT